jgi:hypothetical protein
VAFEDGVEIFDIEHVGVSECRVLVVVAVMNVVVDSRGARFSVPRNHVEGLVTQYWIWRELQGAHVESSH